MKSTFILILLFLSNIFAQNSTSIQNIINRLPSSTKTAITIKDLTTGKFIFQKNSKVPMIPASNTKLFTTAAALYLMGSEYEISTKIFTDDLLFNKGIIKGNLYIKGFGDPTFGKKELDSLIQRIKKIGIKEIQGDIIGDDSYFDNLYTRDDWIIDERANVKLPPVSALVYNKNQFVIALNSNGKVGNKLSYNLIPNYNFIKIKMGAKITNFRSRPKISSSFTENGINVNVQGGLRKRRTKRHYYINIQNPPLFFAFLFKEELQKNGIKVLGKAKVDVTPMSRIELASKGVALNELIALVNKHSNNYLAECLFKSVGAFFSGEQGNSFYSTQAILTTFDENQIIDEGTSIVDGSGISRFNSITTNSITKLLEKIYTDNYLYEEFYRSLSISGVDGTLKNRRINNFVLGNFHGKTGTLNGVTALSGYLTNRNNHTLAVSIIMEYKSKGSNYHKDFEDRIILELTK